MTTLYQYVKNIGHADFLQQPLNEVDYVILTELVYLTLDDYISESFDVEIDGRTIQDFYDEFSLSQKEIQQDNRFVVSSERLKLAKEVAYTPRYRDLKLFGFHSKIDKTSEMQFAAATFYSELLDLLIVIFRGTDDTLIGWKEDFNMSYQKRVPAQLASDLYLQQIVTRYPNSQLVVTGHSKGGNLAIYASSKLNERQRALLQAVYSFDGPGFHHDFLASEGYLAIESRIHFYIPQDSVVGQILYRTVDPVIVEAKGYSLMQHIPETWEVDKVSFKRAAEVTTMSERLYQTFGDWIAKSDSAELKEFFETVFQLIESTGVESMNDITRNFLGFIWEAQRAYTQIEGESSEIIAERLSKLKEIFNQTSEPTTTFDFIQEVQAKVQRVVDNVANRLNSEEK